MVLLLLFSMGLLSAFLMNDTLAIIGTPLVLRYASRLRISPKLLLLALAFAVTTGSVMLAHRQSQNLLIAINGGIADPFVSFFSRLLVPTVINLLWAYALLRLFYRSSSPPPSGVRWRGGEGREARPLVQGEPRAHRRPGGAEDRPRGVRPDVELRLTYIALAAAAHRAGSSRRLEIVRNVDWPTLVFFASMFVLMAAVWSTGFFQELLGGVDELASLPMVLG